MGSHQWAFLRRQTTESDEQLTDRVRGGDDGAFGELYERHRKAAETTARCLLRSRTEADDVVSEAFTGVLSAIRHGRGPRDNFRTYLLACVRNGCRVQQRLVPIAPSDGMFERPRRTDAPLLEDPERYVEADVVARAFASLTPRWQEVLWSTAVEQKAPHELAASLQLSPNAAAAVAHRARQAFATAYLAEHAGVSTGSECRQVNDQLAAYVRGDLRPARVAEVDQHLAACPSCTAAVRDLRNVNATLRSLLPAGPLAPAVVEAAQQAVVSSLVSGGTGGSGAFPIAALAVKGLAGALLLTPVIVYGIDRFTGGGADGLREPSTRIEAEAAAVPTTRPSPATTRATEPSSPSPDPASPTTIAGDPLVASAIDPALSGILDGPGDAGTPGPGAGASTSVPAAPAPTSSAPTTSVVVATPTTEGLLGTLGVDDLLDPVGLAVVADRIDQSVLDISSQIVAPIVAAVVDQVGLPLDLSLLPELPGVVLVPTTTVAPAGGADPAPDTPATSPPGPSGTTPVTVPAPTSPPATSPPATSPPLTSPPATSPPATSPPATSPPATSPPATQPPATSPPATSPPTTSPGLVCSLLGVLGLC